MWIERLGRVMWNGRDNRGHYDTVEAVTDAAMAGDGPPMCPHACCGGKRAHPAGTPVVKAKKAPAIVEKILNGWGEPYEPYVSIRGTANRPKVTGAAKRRADALGRDVDYQSYMMSRYEDAEAATNGYMVSPAGLRRGYDAADFFKVGRRVSVERWGTDEMKAWMQSGNAAQHGSRIRTVGILTKTQFEQRDAAALHHLNNA